jgi:hypothetical protein
MQEENVPAVTHSQALISVHQNEKSKCNREIQYVWLQFYSFLTALTLLLHSLCVKAQRACYTDFDAGETLGITTRSRANMQ